jgi:ribosomal protein S18 acetylase RimI-like enzyme
MSRIPIRLNPAHAPLYRQLMLQAYELHPDAFTSSVTERAALPLAWWEARLEATETPKEIVFGSFVGDELAGVAGLSFDGREKARHKATLFGMFVHPRFRQLGLASLLLRQALGHAASRPGVTLVQLTVTDGNHAAQALYQRHGFVQFGLEPCAVAVGTSFVAKSHMWCALPPAPLRG